MFLFKFIVKAEYHAQSSVHGQRSFPGNCCWPVRCFRPCLLQSRLHTLSTLARSHPGQPAEENNLQEHPLTLLVILLARNLYIKMGC
jgi:hypothetical protein